MDFDTGLSIYMQIADTIKRKILSGTWQPGDKIPPVREFALEMGVNPNTVQRAVTLLGNEGLLYTERTGGRYVTTEKSKIEDMRQELTCSEIDKFFEVMRGLGYKDKETILLIKGRGHTDE